MDMRIILFIALLLLVISCHGNSGRDVVNYDHPLDVLLDSLSIDPGKIYLHIDKIDLLLSVMTDTIIIKQYPVVLGGNPVDDKFCQGDECTPEGHFTVRTKYPHKSWNKFIWIDYPNEESWKKHNKAKREGVIHEHAKIGGEIGIHGVPKGTDEIIDLGMNWTLGCISLKNMDINDFYPFIRQGTVVIIQK
jgi:murein L,D-transpeptidase YafK